MGEVKTHNPESIEHKELPETSDFRSIKPVSDITSQVAKEFWDKVFKVEQQSEVVANSKATDSPDVVAKEFSSLDEMKKGLEKTYKEIKEEKPPNSPNLAKWFENGGTVKIETVDGHSVWTYKDKDGKEVKYVDGKVVFPPEAKHPVIGDISIGEFTGDRNKDKELYLKKLEEEYGLTAIPEGYALHHDTENGVLQLVRTDYHKEFTHAGGHSMYKEE